MKRAVIIATAVLVAACSSPTRVEERGGDRCVQVNESKVFGVTVQSSEHTVSC